MNNNKRDEIEKAINELVQFAIDYDIDPNRFCKEAKLTSILKEVLYERKRREVLNKLIIGEYREYLVETIVFENELKASFLEKELILEWEQYKKIPKTKLTYRYDTGNTNTKTKDHVHVFFKNNQLYAINDDGTAHDSSTAKLGNKEIKFLKSIGFTTPENGILEWIELDPLKSYIGVKLELLIE